MESEMNVFCKTVDYKFNCLYGDFVLHTDQVFSNIYITGARGVVITMSVFDGTIDRKYDYENIDSSIFRVKLNLGYFAWKFHISKN